MKPGLLYRLLKKYVYFGLKLFYRRYQVHGVENVPMHGPVIFAINHQNAFMDALLVAVSSRRNPWFITRASIFSSSTARYWLGKLQMLPIYRFRDGHTNMKKNDEAMAHTIALLLKNETILIFPEGNHDRHWALRPLQKGIARMAFEVEQQTDFTSGLHIVPVGINYEDHLSSHSEVLLVFGKPISIQNYQSRYTEQPAKATLRLMDELKVAMKAIMLHINRMEQHDALAEAVKGRPKREKDLFERLNNDQIYLEQLEKAETLPAPVQSRTKPNRISCLLAYILFVPSVLPHLPVILFIQKLTKKVVKDDHWTASIKFAAFILLAPFIYLVEVAIVWLLGANIFGMLLFIGFLGLGAAYSQWFRGRFKRKKRRERQGD